MYNNLKKFYGVCRVARRADVGVTPEATLAIRMPCERTVQDQSLAHGRCISASPLGVIKQSISNAMNGSDLIPF